MVKKTQINARKRKGAQGAPGVRVSKLPIGALALAKYHAALSDPFISEAVGIPDGAPAVTFKGKVEDRAVLSSATQLIARIDVETWSTERKVHFSYSIDGGSTFVLLGNELTYSGEGRMVAGGIRVTYAGRRDAMGGMVTSSNSANDESVFRPRQYKRFDGSAVALWEPYRLTDFEFHGGYQDARDGPEDRKRYIELLIESSGDLVGSVLEFVAIYETERPPSAPMIQYGSSYPLHHYIPSSNKSAGSHHVANIASRMTKIPRSIKQSTQYSRLSHYKDMLVAGLKHATEVMGVATNAGEAYKQMSAALSLGADLESDIGLTTQLLGTSSLMLTM